MSDLALPLCAERVHFEDWENCWRLTNGIVDLVVPMDFGPRIMRFGFTRKQNLLKTFGLPQPGQRIRGGHRLWAAPEVPAFTWVVDTVPVDIEFRSDGMRVLGAVEAQSKLQKEMTITLAPDAADVSITHRIINRGDTPVRLAPWSLTQMAYGGCGVSGFPPRGEHPRDLLPTGSLVMWSYTNFSDPKWKLLRKYWVVRPDADHPAAQKAGIFLDPPWCAYLLHGDLYIKRSAAVAGPEYPDMGCSVEIFVNGVMIELETMAALHMLRPGESIEHEERWTLHSGITMNHWTDDEIDATIAPLL